MSNFLPGDRVTFPTVAGEMLGTVETPHEDDVYTVRPDDGNFPRLVLLGRSMRPLVEEPVILVGEQ